MEILKDSNIQGKELDLHYPSNWSYKLISTSEDGINQAVKDVIGDREHTLVHSKNSKGGKYTSMNLDIIVNDEDDRNNLFTAFKKDSNIKMVL